MLASQQYLAFKEEKDTRDVETTQAGKGKLVSAVKTLKLREVSLCFLKLLGHCGEDNYWKGETS